MKALQGWVAAVAVLVFGQMMGERVWAEIVYSGPDRNVTYSMSDDTPTFSLFGGEGTWDDIELDASWMEDSDGVYTQFGSMLQAHGNYVDFADDGFGIANKYAEGDVIDSSASFADDTYSDFSRYSYMYDPPSEDSSGEFINTTGYAGFKLTNGSDIYYGWIQISLVNYNNSHITGTLIDWAYNDTPGQAIQVGAVPEPSTLALLGAGMLAGGAALLRRRIRL